MEVPCWEISEDYLGAALIRPGDSVIIKMKWFVPRKWATKRVEPREYSSLSVRQMMESGHFFA